MGAGVNYAYGFFLCDLTIPSTQVVTVEVVVSDVMVYWIEVAETFSRGAATTAPFSFLLAAEHSAA